MQVLRSSRAMWMAVVVVGPCDCLLTRKMLVRRTRCSSPGSRTHPEGRRPPNFIYSVFTCLCVIRRISTGQGCAADGKLASPLAGETPLIRNMYELQVRRYTLTPEYAHVHRVQRTALDCRSLPIGQAKTQDVWAWGGTWGLQTNNAGAA